MSAGDEDILRFDGTTWSLFFDGSDVSVGNLDLDAFYLFNPNDPNTDILMSFDKATTLNGVAVDNFDVVRFHPTSLGVNTAGTFSLYFDGNDVGLDTTGENIDALELLPDGRLLVSTTGNSVVPGVSGLDEDILAFTPTTLGDVTSGAWAMYFDGSDVGLADSSSEDVDALAVDRPRNIQAIAEARAHGDLSENAEYHAAKEQQSFLEGRIQELKSKIAMAQVIDPSTIRQSKVAFQP